jgi:hypothetical protein
MITLQQALDVGQYKITGGAEYQWKCYGPNARYMDFHHETYDKSFSIIYDTKTQEVYEAEVSDHTKNNCYRLINPNYKDDYFYEAESRGVDAKQAYDDVEFIDLDVDQDFMEKAHAIINDLPYDERVCIDIELPDHILLTLMKMAHEQDITFNQLIEQIMIKELEQYDLP